MSEQKYVGAIDQGTTSSRFVIFDRKGRMVCMHQMEHRQIYPRPGWVEHDAKEILDRTAESIAAAMKKGGIRAGELAAIGVTNQRETTVVWNPKTGQPWYNAIVWQDARTDAICEAVAPNGDMNAFRDRVGLPLSTYFSGPKLKWILDNVEGVREAAGRGEAIFGTIDSWLIWWLTGGPDGGIHVTDVTNASRTMMMDLKTLAWDSGMMDVFGVPETMLPEIRASSEVYGYTGSDGVFGAKLPVSGILGDQQAALFGQACFSPGDAKNTYGTGCFLLMNTGAKMVASEAGLLTTVGYRIGGQPAMYALEGSIAIGGSLVQWFRDGFGLIETSAQIEDLARSVPDNGGVYFVPAFSGLFAPHWKSDARGLIIGLTHFANKGHLARAVLEATAFQSREIFDAMARDSGITLGSLRVDGGMVRNELLMQFQADILDISVIRPAITETTVLGAAYAAGLAVGFWQGPDELAANWSVDKVWKPSMDEEKRKRLFHDWMRAVERTYGWLESE